MKADEIMKSYDEEIIRGGSADSVIVRCVLRAVLAEREACASIVQDAAQGFCGGTAETVLNTIAASIRDRSDTESTNEDEAE